MMPSANLSRRMRRSSSLPIAPMMQRPLWETGTARRSSKSNPTCIRRGNIGNFTVMLSINQSTMSEDAWRAVPQGWRQLYGDFDRLGVSVEWHDFKTERPLDWGLSFHPRSVEFCLNVEGHGAVGARSQADYVPGSAGYYALTDQPLQASRQAGDHHQFVTLEFSREHLQKQLVD